MKYTLLTITLMIYALSVGAQIENYNFKLNGNSIYWEKIYDIGDQKMVNIAEHTLSKGVDTTISFNVTGETLNLSKYGVSMFSTRSMALAPFRYRVVVSVKGDRYRVQVLDIVHTVKNIINPMVDPIDIFLDGDVKNGQVKMGNLSRKHYHALNMQFDEKYGPSKINNDDW